MIGWDQLQLAVWYFYHFCDSKLWKGMGKVETNLEKKVFAMVTQDMIN